MITITLQPHELELLANALQAQTAGIIAQIQQQAQEQLQQPEEEGTP